MSSGFEDRLEQELVAAARRRIAARAPRARRRLPRPLLATAAALAVLALLTTLVLAMPGGGGDPRPTAAPEQGAPAACARAQWDPRAVYTTTPADRRLLDALATLRRPQARRDRAACPILPEQVLNPAAIRSAGRSAAGHRLFLVPTDSAADGRPGGLAICLVTVTEDGRPWGGAGCTSAAGAAQGRFTGTFLRSGVRTLLGIFPDHVARLVVRLGDGSRIEVPIRENVASLVVPERVKRGATWFAAATLLRADGRTAGTLPGPFMR